MSASNMTANVYNEQALCTGSYHSISVCTRHAFVLPTNRNRHYLEVRCSLYFVLTNDETYEFVID